MKTFSFKDEKAKKNWKKTVEVNSHDGYGLAGVTYAARWAHLMENEINCGSKLKNIAEKTSHEADKEGVTGFMYGCAVSVLTQVWKYGEELRLWHNPYIQINDEGEMANKNGGVLNPAIINISPHQKEMV